MREIFVSELHLEIVDQSAFRVSLFQLHDFGWNGYHNRFLAAECSWYPHREGGGLTVERCMKLAVFWMTPGGHIQHIPFGDNALSAIYCSLQKDKICCNITLLSQSYKFLRLEYITRFLTCQYTEPLSSYTHTVKFHAIHHLLCLYALTVIILQPVSLNLSAWCSLVLLFPPLTPDPLQCL